MKKTLLILLMLSSVAKADPFSDIWKWVEDSPEIAVPALVLGAPLAIAAGLYHILIGYPLKQTWSLQMPMRILP
jgi:hypothetical protein